MRLQHCKRRVPLQEPPLGGAWSIGVNLEMPLRLQIGMDSSNLVLAEVVALGLTHFNQNGMHTQFIGNVRN